MEENYNRMKDIRTKKIIYASWVAVIGNLILAIAKINIGLISESLAVIGDGIDSSSDIATSLITLFIARILSKPPSKKFPYGYRRADTIAAKALSFVIFFAGAQLAISTITRLFEGTTSEIPSELAIYVTVFSIIGKFILAFFLLRVGKRTDSAMLRANGRNMANDVIISSTVLVGLIFTFIFKTPILDSITALLVSIWIMRTAYQIFMETNIELMDGNTDESLYLRISEAALSIKGVHNPHRMRIRKIGDRYNVSLDIEVDGKIPLEQAHKIATCVEKTIKNELEKVYDVLVHVEPLGEHHDEERFGISNEDI